MIHGLSVLGVIPARGGSKGIPRKNIRMFLGKPLLAWTIEVARESGILDRMIVSTDDEEVAAVGRSCGAEVPFLRPAALAGDDAPTAPAIRHAVERLAEDDGWRPDLVAVLEPTSPARRPEHVREALSLLVEHGADSVASVSEVPHHYSPLKVLKLTGGGEIAGIDGTAIRDMIHRRQDLPPYYAFNGLIFACCTAVLMRDPPTLWGERVVGYVVEDRYRFDIDTPEDWITAEARMAALRKEAALR
jgi:CMP-N-acetylneuraminic acid synthetase